MDDAQAKFEEWWAATSYSKTFGDHGQQYNIAKTSFNAALASTEIKAPEKAEVLPCGQAGGREERNR